jgi:lipid II:glycine glycyltransferase (peptidoglycan interpeptide bridge formation enzyme)
MLERQGRPSWVRWESFEPCGLQGRPADPLQCIATWVSDTTMSEEELFAGMHAKTRYNIRLAAKHDVVVEESRRFDAFLALMHQTAAHDGFHMHAASRYRAVLDCLDGKQGGPRAFLVEAHRGGAPLAMAVGVDWLGVRTYLYGASAWQEREHMAPYALHAWMLADARVRGIGRYDWWGISPSGAARHQLDGVTRFKRGFPGERIETKQPAIDMIFDGAVYGAYRFGRSVKGLLHL